MWRAFSRCDDVLAMWRRFHLISPCDDVLEAWWRFLIVLLNTTAVKLQHIICKGGSALSTAECHTQHRPPAVVWWCLWCRWCLSSSSSAPINCYHNSNNSELINICKGLCLPPQSAYIFSADHATHCVIMTFFTCVCLKLERLTAQCCHAKGLVSCVRIVTILVALEAPASRRYCAMYARTCRE